MRAHLWIFLRDTKIFVLLDSLAALYWCWAASEVQSSGVLCYFTMPAPAAIFVSSFQHEKWVQFPLSFEMPDCNCRSVQPRTPVSFWEGCRQPRNTWCRQLLLLCAPLPQK